MKYGYKTQEEHVKAVIEELATPQSTWEEKFNKEVIKLLDYLNLKQAAFTNRPVNELSYPEFGTLRKLVAEEIQKAEERGFIQADMKSHHRYEDGRLAERTALREVIKKSRTSEETFGVGIREETARNQILVDIELLQD